MLTLGKKKIVLKPATFVLIGAILIALIAPWFLMRQAAQSDLVWKHSNLDIWKFEVHRKAEAILVSSENPERRVQKAGSTASYNIDLNKELEVEIVKTDGAADSVDLRNAINFEELKEREDLIIRFSARAERPHEIIMILRESDQVRWSTKQIVEKEWKDYSVPISFKDCKTFQAIFSIHLGAATGKLTLKNLQIAQR